MIVLDTHAWLWLVSDPGRLGHAAIEAIDQTDDIAVCAISCWELPCSSLPMHGDPADRLIVASAISRNASLVTKDQAIRSAGLVPTVW